MSGHVRLVVDNDKPQPLAIVFWRRPKDVKNVRDVQHAVWLPESPTAESVCRVREHLPAEMAQQLLAVHEKGFCFLIFKGGPNAPLVMHRALKKAGFNSGIQEVRVHPQDAILASR